MPKLRPHLTKKDTVMRKAITVEKQLDITLYLVLSNQLFMNYVWLYNREVRRSASLVKSL